MNRIDATITEIKSMESINIVNFQVKGQTLCMMALELDKSLRVGSQVVLGAKATSVSLAKGFDGMLSMSNQLPSKVDNVRNGELLSSIKLHFFDTQIESVITRGSSVRMDIKAGDEVLALIKASELFIVEIRTK